MKEQNKTPEKELHKMEITNLSDEEFKTMVIRMFKELIEYDKNIREEMKVTLSEIKKNLQGINSGEDDVKNQINDLEHKEGKSIQSEQQEENWTQKIEDRLRNLSDNFKHSNIGIIGVPAGEEEEQEIENLFEKIMKVNFPSLTKELVMQVQEAQRVPKRLDPRRNTLRHIIIKLPKIKDKERILKAEREKERVTTKEFPLDYQLISQKKPYRQKGV